MRSVRFIRAVCWHSLEPPEVTCRNLIKFNKGKYIRGRTIPSTRTGWGQSAEKHLGRGGPGSQGCQQTDHEPAMCPWSKKGWQPPELHESVLREMNFPCPVGLLSPGEKHLQSETSALLHPVLDAICDSVRNRILEQVWHNTKKMTKILKHLTHKEGLKDLGVFSLGKTKLRGILTLHLNTWWQRGLKMESDIFHGAQWQDQSQWAWIKPQEIAFKHEEKGFKIYFLFSWGAI